LLRATACIAVRKRGQGLHDVSVVTLTREFIPQVVGRHVGGKAGLWLFCGCNRSHIITVVQ
jgi:hypothetical protein